MIDIDNFKKINDTYGHLVGDECIRQVASLLRTVVKRETDIVARYGGEEFVVLMSGVTVETAHQIAEEIRESVESLIISSHGTEIRLTVSIGLASMVPRPELTSSELLERADNALYAAKDNGRNKVMFETAA